MLRHDTDTIKIIVTSYNTEEKTVIKLHLLVELFLFFLTSNPLLFRRHGFVFRPFICVALRGSLLLLRDLLVLLYCYFDTF